MMQKVSSVCFMDYGDECIGNNRPEDVDWLCRLTEAEIDLLIYLKGLAIRRANISGRDELANEFNLQKLRSLGFVLLERLKERQKDWSDAPNLVDFAKHLDRCNLLNSNLSYTISNEDLKACIETKSQRRKDKSNVPSCTPDGVNEDGDADGSNPSMSLWTPI